MKVSDITVKVASKRLDHVLNESNLGFGKLFTDHMFTMDYSVELGWYDPRIEPYAPVALDPAAMIMHYGQGVFEGMKCYRAIHNDLVLFRPEDNFARLNNSCDLLCMPRFDQDFVLEALKKLLVIEANWVPKAERTSLYIRPTIVATEGALGVRPANFYRFFIILSPVSAYYAEGLSPIKIRVAKEHVRVARGSVGEAKTIGNYAAGLFASRKAQRDGFTQVLWLDSVERKYIEEVGVMNIFFLIGDELITPRLSGSILAGITRDSVTKLARSWGVTVIERSISIEEIFNSHRDGSLKEAFGTGTAVVISPIGELEYNGCNITIGHGGVGPFSQKLFDSLTRIQYCEDDDTMKWLVKI